MCHKALRLIWSIWGFYRSKGFEAMKAGKLAIQPWLSCRVTKNTLMDEPWAKPIQFLKMSKNYKYQRKIMTPPLLAARISL